MKTALIQFRVTRQERARLEYLASKRGVTLSEFLRTIAKRVKK